jgi:hypothetical protein
MEKKRHLPLVKLVLDQDKQPIGEEFIDLQDVQRGTLTREWLIRKVLKDGEHGVLLENCPVRMAVSAFNVSDNTIQPGDAE